VATRAAGPILVFVLALSAGSSLRWRVVHDAPVLMFVSRCVDSLGLVPYRDVFDMNPPGAMLAYIPVARVAASCDLCFRLIDLGCLAVILVFIATAMKPFGRSPAITAPALFGLAYLGFGENQSLQRDFLAILPIAFALAVALRDEPDSREVLPGGRAFLIGLAIGAACLFKPNCLIAAPVLLAPVLASGFRNRARWWARFTKLSGLALAGFVVLPVLSALYLWRVGGLRAFVGIVRNYWPLYAELDGLGRRIAGEHAGMERLMAGFGPPARVWPWFLLALLGGIVALRGGLLSSPLRLRFRTLVALVPAFWIYVVVAGKFWKYHWFPAILAACLLASLATLEPRDEERVGWVRFRVIALLLPAIVLGLPADLRAGGLAMAPLEPVKGGRVAFVETFLRSNLRPGDRVQALDVTEGVLHGMLRAGATPATRFVYDFHFYHHVSNPYIQGLRREFVEQLEKKSPRFVVQIPSLPSGAGWSPSGEDCGGGFPELEKILSERYREVSRFEDVHIFEKRPPLPAETGKS